jgi:hypothetical protein
MNEQELLLKYTEWLHKQRATPIIATLWELKDAPIFYSRLELIQKYLSENPSNVFKLIREGGTG